MNIPIAKPYFDELEGLHVADVLKSGWVTQGPKVAEFEKMFCEYTGAKHSIAVSSCTTALHLALLVSGVGQDDEVICPSMSYIATANAIKHCGAKVVFAEVTDDLNLDISDVNLKITPKTKAIILVHQIGNPADIDGFRKLCDSNGLALIEDAACAIGSSYKNKLIGASGNLTCFSFHPRKVITTGDGGMICTSDSSIAERLKALRQHGMSVNDLVRHNSESVITEVYKEVGYNYRLTDIQAAVGIEQLKKLPSFLEKRRKIASVYNKAFADLAHIELIKEANDVIFNYQSYAIRLKPDLAVERNAIMQALLDSGIATRRGIMMAHKEPAYANQVVSLPTTEAISSASILLPIYHQMTMAEVEYVISNVQSIII